MYFNVNFNVFFKLIKGAFVGGKTLHIIMNFSPRKLVQNFRYFCIQEVIFSNLKWNTSCFPCGLSFLTSDLP